MKYLLLIYAPDNAITDAERAACYEKSAQLACDLKAAGQYLSANPLAPVSTARSVRLRDGKRLVTDGPFAETREHLGGYFLIEATDLDEAIAVAARIPAAAWGSVEIRPVQDLGGLPDASPGVTATFMLLSYDDEQYWRQAGDAAMDAALGQAVRLACELRDRGQYVLASPLHWPETATTVRLRDGKRVVTDGPFAETREVLGGFYLVHVDTAEEAAAIAARHPGAAVGTVEIRPILPIPGLPG